MLPAKRISTTYAASGRLYQSRCRAPRRCVDRSGKSGRALRLTASEVGGTPPDPPALRRKDPCHESWVVLAGSTERLTLTGCCGRLDRVEHAMARDGVVERGAEMRSLAIVVGETRVRLGDVGGNARFLRRRPPILLWHGQDLERGLRALAAACGHLEHLGM